MSGIKGKDTKPEILVRQLLHRAGYRFRLHRKDLPGRPDLVLSRYNTALFVNGCFWHGHEDCHLFRLPKSRQDFWEVKISGNKARDLRKQTELFECERRSNTRPR
ncbi:very short patch repair endonuclease [Thalassovita mediterranea]|nr:very short patch repair endonuclease [Thalassovita mediterranea]